MPSHADRNLETLRRWAALLDNAFRVPGTDIRFGLDPILGLIPGIGDLATPVLSVLLLVHGARVRVPKIVLARMVINAVPFLLPLMFQVAFGWTAVQAGLMVMAVFVGNVVIKPATSPLIRRFGFRTVIVASSSGGALTLVACAFLRPTTPAAVIAGVLLLSGAMRSIGFSGYNSLQFADIPSDQMSPANTLHSTLAQLASGLGVAVAALALRLAESVLTGLAPQVSGHGVLLAYQVAFGLLAVMMLYPVTGGLLGLHRSAGGEVASAAR